MDVTGFGIRLFREAAARAEGGARFVSPLGAALALAIVYDAATGETRAEMARLLGLDLDAGGAARAFSALRESLETDEVELAAAASLWAKEGLAFAPGFLRRAREVHGARIESVDFGDAGTAARMNAWAEEETRGMIGHFVDPPFDPLTLLFVVSAVYFKGCWETPFAREATRPAPFHRADGTSVDVPTMTRTGGAGYLEGDGVTGVRLPYGGGRFALYVVVPDAGGVDALADGLTPERWEEWTRGFQEQEVAMEIPRFAARGGFDLVAPLAALGMASAFDSDSAELGGLLPPGWPAALKPYVSQATQDTYVRVDEEGTEAAAVTSIAFAIRGMVAAGPVRFAADRPFLAAVRDDETGALLFIGRVDDPGAGGTDG
jgi:serine protease inhibitor